MYLRSSDPLETKRALFESNVFNRSLTHISDTRCDSGDTTNEPPHGKTNNLHMRKQRCRSALR